MSVRKPKGSGVSVDLTGEYFLYRGLPVLGSSGAPLLATRHCSCAGSDHHGELVGSEGLEPEAHLTLHLGSLVIITRKFSFLMQTFFHLFFIFGAEIEPGLFHL